MSVMTWASVISATLFRDIWQILNCSQSMLLLLVPGTGLCLVPGFRGICGKVDWFRNSAFFIGCGFCGLFAQLRGKNALTVRLELMLWATAWRCIVCSRGCHDCGRLLVIVCLQSGGIIVFQAIASTVLYFNHFDATCWADHESLTDLKPRHWVKTFDQVSFSRRFSRCVSHFHHLFVLISD